MAATKKTVLSSGELAFRSWAENLPVVGEGLRSVRYAFLSRMQEIVELGTEGVGTMLFALLGGVADPVGTGRDGWPALGNGLTLAVLVYMTAKVSGGKLNPAVSFGLYTAGSLPLRKCALECMSQIIGGIFGAILSRLLVLNTTHPVPTWAPWTGSAAGCSSADPSAPGCFQTTFVEYTTTSVGCFTAGHGTNGFQVFLWEFITTFVLVNVVFATAVDDAAAATFVSIAPFVIGLSLFACAQASGPYTGGCLNPARFIGPWMVWADRPECQSGGFVIAYVAGEMLGGCLAGILFKARLRLINLYKETIQELAEKNGEVAEGENAGMVENAA